jgi:hypothetical protein
MKVKRYQTSQRLWFFITLAIFILFWFIPSEMKGSRVTSASFLLMGLGLVFESGMTGTERMLMVLCCAQSFIFLTLLFGVPAMALGWVLQSIIQIVRHREVMDNTQDPSDTGKQ